MPQDVQFPFQYDETGDVATVTGNDFYVQHGAQLALIAIDGRLGEPLTANDITEIESAVERTFRSASPYFEEPLAVRVTDVVDERLELQVQLGGGQTFTIPPEQLDTSTL